MSTAYLGFEKPWIDLCQICKFERKQDVIFQNTAGGGVAASSRGKQRTQECLGLHTFKPRCFWWLCEHYQDSAKCWGRNQFQASFLFTASSWSLPFPKGFLDN